MHSLRRVFHIIVVSWLLMLLGDYIPIAKERRIRGEHAFITDEHLAIFKMYDDTAAKAYTEMKQWLRSHFPPQKYIFGNSPTKDTKLCVGIITARRVNAMVLYLRQIVSALLTRMNVSHGNVYMHIYNVNARPQDHGQEIDLVREWFPVTNVKAPKPLASHMDLFTDQIQESLDYSIIIRDLVKMGCHNALLLEDDALPNEHWLEKTLDAIRFLESRKGEWFIVRLFVARWRGWYPKPPTKITSYDQGFNTVAVLMNGKHMKRFADEMDAAVKSYLNGGSFFEAKDIFMGQFKRSSGLPIESLEPGPFQHTGLYSSRSARNIRSFAWYMASKNFESEAKPIVFDRSRWNLPQH